MRAEKWKRARSRRRRGMKERDRKQKTEKCRKENTADRKNKRRQVTGKPQDEMDISREKKIKYIRKAGRADSEGDGQGN